MKDGESVKRRIFVALCISGKLTRQIIKWEKNWTDLPVRWLDADTLHLTLVPPWYIENIEPVLRILEKFKNTASVKTLFTRVTFGPYPHRPRLIWAEGELPRELGILREELFTVLKRKKEKRPLLLHVTLARFAEKDFKTFPLQELNENIKWEEKFSSLCVFETHLRRTGAVYKKLWSKKLT